MIERKKIPVLIVTGFLGSGKTTFINHLLKENKELKFGLIENEFGETSIDTQLVQGLSNDHIVELSNGCICCSVFNEFSLALQELAKKYREINYLLIETTGVADPGPVIEPFFQDEDLSTMYELTGTVCLVDCLNFHGRSLNIEQQKQLILSDLILLNKTEELSPEQLNSIRKIVLAYNSTAIIHQTNYSKTDTNFLKELQPAIQQTFEKKLTKPLFVPEHSHYQSEVFTFSGEIDRGRFIHWFEYFASINKSKIFRIKGIVRFQNDPLKAIVQSVGGFISITEGSVNNPFEEQVNKLVMIGKSIDKTEIEAEMKQFLFQQ